MSFSHYYLFIVNPNTPWLSRFLTCSWVDHLYFNSSASVVASLCTYSRPRTAEIVSQAWSGQRNAPGWSLQQRVSKNAQTDSVGHGRDCHCRIGHAGGHWNSNCPVFAIQWKVCPNLFDGTIKWSGCIYNGSPWARDSYIRPKNRSLMMV